MAKTTEAVMIENGRLFGKFLNKATMNNQIQDILLHIEDGHISANSIDSSMTMFSICSFFVGETTLEEEYIGIPQVATLIKHLDTDEPYKLIVGKDRIAITTKSKKGALRFRTIQKADISTVLSDEINEEALDLDSRIHFELNGDKLEELLGYISLTTCSCVIFEINKGKLYAMTPDTDVVQFKLYVAKVKTKGAELRVATYAKPLSCILTTLKEAPVSFYLRTDSELVLEQEGNHWGVGCIEE